ncbi:MAG: hypothetical protein KAS15_03830 [Nanoarchaeota archaeon]|nr:hypothetical protein [Nanoarchaeota archaeon]
MEETIWTPRLYGKYNFGVNLDKDFARDAIQLRIPIERQTRMNKLANKELERLRTNWLDPYTFHGDSCLITQCYIGQNGVGLSLDYQIVDNLLKDKIYSKVIEYDSHNVDTPSQAYVLMTLFDKWVEYADAVKNV